MFKEGKERIEDKKRSVRASISANETHSKDINDMELRYIRKYSFGWSNLSFYFWLLFKK